MPTSCLLEGQTGRAGSGRAPAAGARASGVALLFGVPVTRDEFERRAGESDWLRKFYHRQADPRARRRRLQQAWERDYEPWIADPFTALRRRASRLGAEVSTGATLDTLRAATAEKSVVVLVSHWKGPEIVNDDFVEPVIEAAFLARARRSDSAMGRWLCRRLEARRGGGRRRPGLWRSLFGEGRGETLREVIRQAVDAEIEDFEANEADGLDEVLEHPATRAARRRDALDEVLADLLRPGNRLELFDGLHKKEAVAAAVAPGFEGMLDLTTCTSSYLADFISSRHRQRLRTTQLPAVQEPLWAAKHLEWTLELVAGQGLGYLEARELAGRKLKQAVVDVSRQSKPEQVP